MKSKIFLIRYSFLLIFLSLSFQLISSNVEATGFNTDGHTRVKPNEKTDLLDPENPMDPVDPGEGPSTTGDLRIDFVSTINFSDTEITKNNRNSPSLAQLFHSETSSRAPYIQITDLREGLPGWNLQLKQETQFRNKDKVELSGANLSFDKGWANSGGTGTEPTMFRDMISINDIGNVYQVASANKGSGNGTWLLSFGASKNNNSGQENTLELYKDKNGKVLIDPIFKKEIYTNSAIKLNIPDKTEIIPGRYQTTLTWILQATP